MSTTPPGSMVDVTLPRYPSTESLSPDDAPLRFDADAYATKNGGRNLEIIQALANKEEEVRPNNKWFDRPLTSNDIIWLLAQQVLRRRKQVYDDEKGSRNGSSRVNVTTDSGPSSDTGAALRSQVRQRQFRLHGQAAWNDQPLSEPQALPWSTIDEAMIRIAGISDLGDFDYTGRVDRVNEDHIAQQIELFFYSGELPSPNAINLPFINGLFGTLHIMHVLEANETKVRDWRFNLPANVPMDADGLIRAVRDMRLEHSIAPERTKISDLLVCGIALFGPRCDTSCFEQLTDSTQNRTDNAHQDVMMPFKFVALGFKCRHSAIAKSAMYDFSGLDEAKLIDMWQSEGLTRISELELPLTSNGYDCVEGFDALKRQLKQFEGYQAMSRKKRLQILPDQASIKIALLKAAATHELVSSTTPIQEATPKQGATRDHVPSQEQIEDARRGKAPIPNSSPRDSRSSNRLDLLYGIQEGRNNKSQRSDSPPPEAEPRCLRSVEAIFAINPATAAGKEPYLLSRTLRAADIESPEIPIIPVRLSSPHHPRLSSELPKGMPQEHAAKMGLKGDFGCAGIAKVPATASCLQAEPLPSGPLSMNYPILASMLAEERKEAEYARWKCAQAERHASECNGNAIRYAAELGMIKQELERIKEGMAKMHELKEMWESRCADWEMNYGHMVMEHGDEFLA